MGTSPPRPVKSLFCTLPCLDLRQLLGPSPTLPLSGEVVLPSGGSVTNAPLFPFPLDKLLRVSLSRAGTKPLSPEGGTVSDHPRGEPSFMTVYKQVTLFFAEGGIGFIFFPGREGEKSSPVGLDLGQEKSGSIFKGLSFIMLRPILPRSRDTSLPSSPF